MHIAQIIQGKDGTHTHTRHFTSIFLYISAGCRAACRGKHRNKKSAIASFPRGILQSGRVENIVMTFMWSNHMSVKHLWLFQLALCLVLLVESDRSGVFSLHWNSLPEELEEINSQAEPISFAQRGLDMDVHCLLSQPHREEALSCYPWLSLLEEGKETERHRQRQAQVFRLQTNLYLRKSFLYFNVGFGFAVRDLKSV